MIGRRLRVSGFFLAASYAVLGLGDYVLSLAAFRLGVPEGNPVLRWAAASGVGAFTVAKLALTGGATGLIAALAEVRAGRIAGWAGLAAMLLVDAYHVLALRLRLGLA